MTRVPLVPDDLMYLMILKYLMNLMILMYRLYLMNLKYLLVPDDT
jgi:hypothetical protein